jgi:Tol biopolymer transport system component
MDIETGNVVSELEQVDSSYIYLDWSPDGRWLAFLKLQPEHDYALYVADGQTGETRLLAENVLSGLWSPDSKHIAYYDVESGTEIKVFTRQILSVVDVDTGEIRLLTHHSESDHLQAWSPDSQKVLVNSNRDGTNELYLVDIDTGEAERLTSENFLSVDDLSYSPDSRWLAFHSEDDAHGKQMYVLDMQDYSVTQLTNEGYNYSPRWQPW